MERGGQRRKEGGREEMGEGEGGREERERERGRERKRKRDNIKANQL